VKILNLKILNIIFSVCFLPSIFLSQGIRWGDYKPLYSDNNITIEVQFKNYGCASNKDNLIQYRYKGDASFNKEYLVWSFDYIDCSGNLNYKTVSLDISLEGLNSIRKDDWQRINTGDKFNGNDIVDKFYSIYLSKTIKSNSGLKPVTKSTKPNRIKTNGNFYCGQSVKLEVEGGSLSPGSDWYWFENSCGGITPIGKGSSIYVSPKKDTKFYVRAEGKDVTACAELVATIKLNDPTSIIGSNAISFGEKTTLKVANSTLCDGYYWEWYEGNINNTPIGSGNEITINPFETTTYFVRAIGLGSKSNYVQKTVSVDGQTSINSNVVLNNSNIQFTYDIKNCNGKDLYNMKLKGYKKNGEKLRMTSLKGDIINVGGCNQKQIVWNYSNDGHDVNEQLFFKLSGEKQMTFPVYKHVIKSIIWPGWGDFGVNTNEYNNKILGLGAVGYCLIGNAILFNKLSKNSNNKYLAATDNNDIEKYNNNTNLFKNISLLSALASSLVITIDVARIVKRFERAKRNPVNDYIPYYPYNSPSSSDSFNIIYKLK
jgi:hypothetical protein